MSFIAFIIITRLTTIIHKDYFEWQSFTSYIMEKRVEQYWAVFDSSCYFEYILGGVLIERAYFMYLNNLYLEYG